MSALQLLTAVPVPFASRIEGPHQRWAAMWFPLVGLALGGLLLGFDLILAPVLPAPPRTALVLLLLALLTRFIHIDGLMDTFDGAFAIGSREERLAMMRDPRVGAFGVGGGVLVLLAKYALLAAMPDVLRSAALVLTPTVGRWAATQAIGLWPYARREGLGTGYAPVSRAAVLAVSTLLALGSAYLLAEWDGLIAAGIATLAAAAVSGLLYARFGGLTGDSYGAIVEIGEVACVASLLGAATLTASGV